MSHEFAIAPDSGKLITPVDDVAGLPYCFAPPEDLAPVVPKGYNFSRLADWNHMFPRHEVRTTEDVPALDELGRAALLGSRVQWVDFAQHHDIYNPLFVGPPVPQTTEELLTTLVMAEAGYIPEMAIELADGDPKIVGLTDKQRRNLWRSGQVRVWDRNGVRDYLFRHVLSQEVDHINQGEMRTFLHTTDPDLRLELGHRLTAKIVERAVEPVDPVYTAARRAGLLTEQAPRHIRDFVKPRLRPGRNFHKVLVDVHKRLRSEEAAA